MDDFDIGMGENEFRDAEEDPYQVQTNEQDEYLFFALPDAITALERVKHILASPCIATRCSDLSIFLSHTPVEDLRGSYEYIVQHVFGWTTGLGWNLKAQVRETPTLSAQRVQALLGSQGPIIALAYRLMNDPHVVFDFPVSCLPVPLERRILRNEVPPFIASKLAKPEIMNLNFESPKLKLNAFEFFFFHFAFVELGNSVENMQHSSGWAAVTETIYSNLLDDYLNFFFPCTGYGVPPIQCAPRPVDSAASFLTTPTNRRGPLDNDDGEERPKLFKASMYQDASLFRETGVQPTIPTRQKEIWRTETLLNIFINMWLSVETSENGPYQFETLLPSVDLVKSVRTLVRHFHYFTNCVSTKINHPLDEVRRSGFPVFQKKVYLLLRYLFTRWPLDNSFRIVYETWLSYIQPWRYLNPGQAPSAFGDEHEELLLEGRFHAFIFDNILCYTYLFQQVLPRLLRTDLSSIRNAHMLYRIAKVFAGIHALKRILLEIEQSLLYDSPNLKHLSTSLPGVPLGTSSPHSHFVNNSDISPTRSPLSLTGQITQHEPSNVVRTLSTSRHPLEFTTSGLRLASVKQLMKELEGTNFIYSSLFSADNREKFSALLSQISEAIESLNDDPLEPIVPLSRMQTWTTWVFGLDKETIALNTHKKVQHHERGRVIYFLENARSYLGKLADLPQTEPTSMSDSEIENTLGNTFELSATALDSNNLDLDTSKQSVLRKGQFTSGMLQPRGNPDLEPPRRHEVRILIRFLHKVSRYLNKYVVPWTHKAYYEDNFRGRVYRALLARPLYFIHQEKGSTGHKIQIKKYLPPRVLLRPLGNHNLPYHLFFCSLVLAFIGVRGLGWIVTPLLLYFIYVLAKTVLEPTNYAAQIRTEFSASIPGSSPSANDRASGALNDSFPREGHSGSHNS